MWGSLSFFRLACSNILHPGSTVLDDSPNERISFVLLTNFWGALLAISIKLKASGHTWLPRGWEDDLVGREFLSSKIDLELLVKKIRFQN